MFKNSFHVFSFEFVSFSLEWLLDKQYVNKYRQEDLKVLSEDEYQKIMIFFANGKLINLVLHKFLCICSIFK